MVVACLALLVALGGTGYATVLQVPRGSVGSPQLKNSAVTTSKLAGNAVTSAKVRNGTLVKADFKGNQLPAGPTGPVGPAGPPGLSGLERVEFTSPNNSQPLKSYSVTCPSGKRLLGGGARLNPSLVGVGIAQSYPSDDNIYRVSAREFVANPSSWSVTVFAVCASAS
jgi:hypothetical protein